MNDAIVVPSVHNEIDWSEISYKFKFVKMVIGLFRSPSDEDVEMHEIGALTGDQTESILLLKEKSGLSIQLGSEPWMSRARELSETIRGADISQYIGPFAIQLDWCKEIETAIKSKVVTTNFLNAWLRIGELYGRSIELEELSAVFQKSKLAESKSGQPTDNRVRECWYAHWMTERRVFARQYVIKVRDGKAEKIQKRTIDSGRKRAEAELVDLCLGVIAGEIESPLKPEFYNRQWFQSMLGRERKGMFDISQSFKRIGRDRITKLVKDPAVKRSALPPVYQDRFRRRNNP